MCIRDSIKPVQLAWTTRHLFGVFVTLFDVRFVISIGKWSRSTLHDRRGGRLGLLIERSTAEKVPLPTIKFVLAPVFKKTNALFSNRSLVLNPALSVL